MSTKNFLSKEQWGLIYQDFLEKKLTAHIKGGQWTLKDHATAWDVNEQTLKSRASMHKWYKDVNEYIDNHKDNALAEQQKTLLINEVEIRNRHMAASKALQTKALEYLLADNTKLKPNEALRMLELAVDIERRAGGIGMMVGVSSSEDSSKPVSVNEVTKSMVDFFNEVKKKVKNKDVSEGIIIDAKPEKST